jgi:NADPH-dependent 2,4-dienoyl-CoA reductase/sulfur reductase-like enzyme
MEIARRRLVHLTGAAFAAAILDRRLPGAEPPEADVCVYGGTASGVAAAIGAADAGARVVVVEPSRWLGGMSGGGLNAIDWGNRRTVGALARRLLIDRDDVAMRELYKRELAARHVPVIYEHRLAGATTEAAHIRRIRTGWAARPRSRSPRTPGPSPPAPSSTAPTKAT